MSTTEVILEHLISGMQAAIWLFLLVILAFGYAWLDWNVVKEIPSEWVIALLAIIYPIGIPSAIEFSVSIFFTIT